MSSVLRAAEVEPAPVEWLWRERIETGVLTLVGGQPSKGKSLFAWHLAAYVSKNVGAVIYSTTEERMRQSARPRLEAAGGDLGRVRFWTPTLPRDLGELERLIRKHRVRLVVLDPVAAHLEPNIAHDQSVRAALTPLAHVLDQTDCTVLGIVHVLKHISPNAHPLAVFPGPNGGLLGQARSAFLFGPNPNDADEHVLACAKPPTDCQKPRSLAFELDVAEIGTVGERAFLVEIGECDVTDREMVAGMAANTKGARKPPEKRAAAIEWLVSYLRSGPRPVKDIKEDALQYGHSWMTIRRAAEDELDIVKSAKGGPGVTWALPQELIDALEDGEVEDGSDQPEESDDLWNDFEGSSDG